MSHAPVRGQCILTPLPVRRERLRLVAQALAGTALAGKKDDGAEHLVATTASEQAALKKLVANWKSLIETRLSDIEIKTGQRELL